MSEYKYALVTGCDHGVGFSLVKELLNRGYFVIACRLDLREKQVDELYNANHSKMAVLELDISSDDSVSNMAQQVHRLVPYIDILINNAGILGDMTKVLGDDLDFEEIQRVINVNAVGTLRVTNALSELVMKSEGKTIVNISSEAGSIEQCFREGWFGYGMSKAANNMQSALVHNNIRGKGGRVIAMHPGHVATYMRGHLDTTASIDADTSAQGILRVVLDTELPVNDRPLYLNYKGDSLKW